MFKPLRTLLTAAAIGMLSTVPAHAGGTDILLNGGISQAQFDTVITELGTAVAYHPNGPAEPEGMLGFDVGLAVTVLDVDQAAWNNAVADTNAPSTLVVPRLQARKGLPMGIDIGVSYITVPGSDVAVIGGEIRKALIKGCIAMPAVSVLAHYSTLTGVDEIDLDMYGLDLGISKGFLNLTPYAGIGQLWISGSENSALVTLADADESVTRGYVGIKIALLPILNVVAQAEVTGDTNSYTLRINMGL